MTKNRQTATDPDRTAVQIVEDGRRIVSIQGICGGDPCLEGTRVAVWVLERARRFHKSVDEFREDYPFLTAADLRAAWDYADRHTEDINRQIRENEEA